MAQDAGSLPLTGIRVVEVGYAMAGPLTARYLGHFGADVIRIESLRKPDSLRVSRSSWLPRDVGSDIAHDTQPLLNLSSAEKRSIVLEIDRPDGYEAFSRIVAAADVLVTNLSADAIPKLRLGYDDIKAIRPDVIYLATTAFGHEGPYRSFRTWGMNLCAVSGLDAATMTELFAERGGDPARAGKKDPLDPLVWLAARPAEPSWPSPLGRGRPGSTRWSGGRTATRPGWGCPSLITPRPSSRCRPLSPRWRAAGPRARVRASTCRNLMSA